MLDESLLDKNRKYLVGVSGGVDSMALLDMLVKKAYNVIVVHYNYHFREDSDLDENLVRSYCQNHHLPFYVRQGDKKEYQKGNFEMLAREKRYAFYKEIGDLNGIDTIILGHHLNDHLETIVMQLQRYNTKGYLGIKEQSYVKNMHVVRPLLKLKKQQLIDYCTKNHLEYHEDYTNYDTRYTRNHVRHIDLKKYNEQELLEKASKHNQQYKKQQAKLQQIYQEYDQNHFLYLDKLPTESLDQIIYYMLKKEIYPPLITENLVKEIIKQIHSQKPNIEISLPVNFVFIKKYNNIAVRKKEIDDTYYVKYESFYKDQQLHYFLTDQGHLHDGVFLSKEDFPIVIRCFKNGDTIKTSGGTKKVSRLFIDRKIPRDERKIWPIVENCHGEIILIPHIAKNIKYLYTKPNVFVIKYDTCKWGVRYAQGYKRNIIYRRRN